MTYEENWRHRLHDLQETALYRTLPDEIARQASLVSMPSGRSYLNFSSNDYLGLSGHPALIKAFERGLREGGVGSGASRLVTGTMSAHCRLEESLAEYKGTEAALIFTSGYAAALGTIPAIVGRGDIILMDKLSHACLVDAARLSGAQLRVFPHNDMGKLERLLVWSRKQRKPNSTVLVVTESVFSMDGDTADLIPLVELAESHDAIVLLDEAHATGVIGPRGRGLAAELGLTKRIAIHMGTLSKALGCAGGFIAGSSTLIQLLVNSARSFIYSTAPPPALAVAAQMAIQLVNSQDGEDRRQNLRANIELLEKLLDMPPRSSPTPIVPIILGDEKRALAAAQGMRKSYKLILPAIRYPTVPRCKARLRISLRADHTHADLRQLADGLKPWCISN